MKIQLVWINFDCPVGLSMGVAYISAALKAAGHQTSCIHISEWVDYPYDPDRFLRDVKAYDPDLVAFSFTTGHSPEAKILMKILKEDGVEAPILCGGIHTTLNMEEMINYPFVDFANIGEGDDSIVDLANALEQGIDTTNIPNVWARKNGKVIENAARPLKDISRLPYMDMEIWDVPKIIESRRGWFNVYMNRGCPYRCTYCHNNGEAKVLQESYDKKTSGNLDIGYLRFRDPYDMIEELEALMEMFDITAFSFNDDCFTMNKDQMKIFLPLYKDRIGIPFVCNTTVTDVDRELLNLMAEAKCDLIRYGVETATDRIRRDILKRTFSNEKTLDTFMETRKAGIRSFAYLILGNPGETMDEMYETIHFTAKLMPDGYKINIGYPFPGTEYYDIAEEMNMIDHSYPHFHNFIRDSKFKWSPEDRVRMDKIRAVSWIWMNVDLNNGASKPYKELVNLVESFSMEEWKHPSTEEKLLDMDEEISRELSEKKITHWSVPFKDRPEIVILMKGDDFLAYETLDPH